jgi:WD40 repeat protein
VSTSTDGRVVKWTIKKGLDSQDLMLLKREPNLARNETKKGDGQISRYASALTLDFSKRDPNIYLAGTEDGLIHRCSQSYNEQYLNTYVGHTGPVNRIRWCPNADNVFISCSSDWTIKVWKEEAEKPQLSLTCNNEIVTDVSWSDKNATVFASVTDGGKSGLGRSLSRLFPPSSPLPVGSPLTDPSFRLLRLLRLLCIASSVQAALRSGTSLSQRWTRCCDSPTRPERSCLG